MHDTSQSMDLEVLRHYEGMRDNLTGFVHIWLSLEQMMVREDFTHCDEVSDDSWLSAVTKAMEALECLTDIVTNAPPPTPLHWARWRKETAKQLAELDLRFLFSMHQPKRP